MNFKSAKMFSCAPIVIAAAFLPLSALAQEVPVDESRVEDADVRKLETVVVTGVLSGRNIEDAPISVTAVSEAELARQSATSAADVLKNIPGVFVNSSFGETRSIIFSRGVSANSNEAAAGYYYVSLQEDSLPVENKLLTNFGPDYFSRPDIMLSRVEGLRGGTAAITGPNAPGGIFNYITKTGKSDPGHQIQTKVGLQGDNGNAFYRIDGYSGGQIGDSSLYYAVGGFYREDEGARDVDYTFNKGGQIRGNLLWDYEAGSVQLTGKYLNDHNGFWGFLPAVNFGDPSIAPGFDNNSSLLLTSDAAFDYTERDGSTSRFDPTELVASESTSFGLNWTHEISDTWSVQNRARLTQNESKWNSLAIDPASPLTDLSYNFISGNVVGPGTFTFRFPDTGEVAAVMREDFILLGGAPFPVFTVTDNNLPNQLLPDLFSPGLAYASSFEADDFQVQSVFTGDLGAHTLSVGGYYSTGEVKFADRLVASQFAAYEANPRRLDVTYVSDFVPGAVYQVTNPQGWANIGGLSNGAVQTSQQDLFSLFASDLWQLTDRLSFEAGIRYEKAEFDIQNEPTIGFAGNRLAVGGLDGNPLTMYDNAQVSFGTPTRTKRDFEFVNYSASLAYKVNEDFNTYVRYTRGEKAPALNVLAAIDTPDEIQTVFPEPQVIEQLEFGLKYNRDGLNIQAFPFYSRLTNVASPQVFLDDTAQLYSPPPVAGEIETFGVEVQGFYDVNDRLSLSTALTLQKAESSNFGAWVANTPLRTDDTLVQTPDGDADNNPDIISRSTASLDVTSAFEVFVTHSYLGDRPANRANAFTLPGYHLVDLGALWQVRDNLSLQFNVNNVFDEAGIMSWSKAGDFIGSLDRQSLSPADVAANPNGPFTVAATPPRSFFLTATLDF